MGEESGDNSILRHPLVIVGVVATLFIGFYYVASPTKNCIREAVKQNPLTAWDPEMAHRQAVQFCRGSWVIIDHHHK